MHVSGGRPGGGRPIGPGNGGRPIGGRGGIGGGFGGGFGGGYGGLYGGLGYGDYGFGGAAYPAYYPPYDSGLGSYLPGDMSGYYPGNTNPMPLPIPGGDTQVPANPAPAMVVVVVPTQTTELWFSGAKTQTMGLKREFVTPPLPPDQIFTYEIRAKWVANGMTYDKTRTVNVRAGMQSYVDFTQEPREQLPPPGGVMPPPGGGGVMPPPGGGGVVPPPTIKM